MGLIGFGIISFMLNRDDSYNHELRERAKRQLLAKEEERKQRIAYEERKKNYLKAMYYHDLQRIPTRGFKKKSRFVGYDMWGIPVYK